MPFIEITNIISVLKILPHLWFCFILRQEQQDILHMIFAEESGLQPPLIPPTTTASAATDTQTTGAQSTITSTADIAGTTTATMASLTQKYPQLVYLI